MAVGQAPTRRSPAGDTRYVKGLSNIQMAGVFISSLSEENAYLNPALLFGLVIFVGTLASRLFQKLHIPQVVGCIIVGIILGDLLGWIEQHTIEKLAPFTMFALGIIGFMIGGELRASVFKTYGKQFFVILFSQGLGAFVLVAAGTSVAIWFVTGRITQAVAMGLVLGAIASATAPAATVNVLWEYKTRGPLTATVLAIVALDDALALLLYRGAATSAEALMGQVHESVLHAVGLLFSEIVGAILLGFLAGVVLYFLLKFVHADDKVLGFSVASLLIVVGISVIPDIDPILPAMTFGITIANLAPRQSRHTFGLVEKFSPPVYTAFFVLAGAHMQFSKVTGWLVLIMVAYVLFRAAGKVVGSWFGAKLSGAPASVRKYLGLCLLPQAGVAIGLAILSGQMFGRIDPAFGTMMVMVVMTGTFLMEILGPVLVKVGVKRAGEVGLNITEDDLIKSHKVGDLMDTNPPVLSAGMPLSQVIEIVSSTNSLYYPLVDQDNRLIGAVTLDGIRSTFTTQELNDWLVAMDIMEPVIARTTPDTELEEALDKAGRLHIEHLPVTVTEQDDKFVGLLDCRMVRRTLSAEVLSRQQKAESFGLQLL